ncbi:hypothetical protein Tco_1289847, partial [Tanacetum coccineum]
VVLGYSLVVIVTTGSVVVPPGSVVTTGSVVVPPGSVVTTGSVVVPPGSVVTTGSVVVPPGSVVTTGSVLVYFLILSETEYSTDMAKKHCIRSGCSVLIPKARFCPSLTSRYHSLLDLRPRVK